MDPVSIIVQDTLTHVRATVDAWVDSAAPTISDAAHAVGSAVTPAIDAVASTVVGFQGVTGMHLFMTLVVACGAILALTVGSVAVHRYP